MPDHANVKFKTAVVCDDVRREDNGKEILIGVYSAGIGLRQLPTDLILALWIQYEAGSIGDSSSVVRIIGPSDATLAEARVELQVKKLGIGAIVMRGIPVQIQNVGKLQVQLKNGSSDWILLTELAITISTNPGVTLPFGQVQQLKEQ